MKFSKLLVLSALGLVSLSANAAELIEREAPTPEKAVEVAVAFEVGKTYILYNTGAEMYFTQGSTWSTRGCVVPNKVSAVPIRVAKYSLADAEWDGKTYEIQNYVTNRSAYSWYKACMNEGGDLYLDQTTWANRFYEIQDQGGNVYRLMPNEMNEAVKSDGTQFVGYAGLEYDSSNDSYSFENGDNAERVPLSALTDQNVDWVFYSYEAFDAFEAAKKLKSVIESAEANGIDVSAAVDVYNNEDASLAQIEAAIEALQKAMSSGIDAGTAENPTDATSLITNPNFDDASAAGWSGSSPNMVGSGSHGPANTAEFYQGSNVDMYQELGGMPNGVYMMTMYGLYRSGNADPAYQNFLDNTNYRAKLYATVDGDMLTTDIVNPFEIQNKESFAGATEFGTTASESTVNGFRIPNDPSCARVYFDKGWYKNTLFFYVNDGKARIGVREDGNYIGGDWFPFDEFTLTYYGNTAASFSKWVELSAPDFTGMNVTASLFESYQSTVSSLAASATDKASALSALEQIKEMAQELKANAALWAKYLAKVDEGKNMANNPEFADCANSIGLADVVDMDAEDFINNLSLDNDGLEAEMAKIDQLMSDVSECASQSIVEGAVVTNSYFNNCDFKNAGEGWTISVGGCNFNYGIAEAYGQEFDIHQDSKTPAKKGVYKLDLQGFFRTARNNESLESYQAGTQTCDAGVYLGTADATNKTKVMCVFAEQIDPDKISGGGSFTADGGEAWSDGNYYANDMQSANTAFQAGMYYNTAFGIVKNDGEIIRIGVGGKLGGSDWICWDNFILTYMGYESTDAKREISNLLTSVIEEMEKMILTDEGEAKPMGKSLKAQMKAAEEAGLAAQSNGEGQKMFDALCELFDMKAKIEASIALFAELNQLCVEVKQAAGEEGVNEDAADEAGALAATIQQGLKNGAYDDEDVPGLKLQLQKARTAMYLPDLTVVPVDVTAVVMSPDYGNAALMTWDDTGENVVSMGNSNNGWEGDAGNFGNDNDQKAAYAYEFYNKTFDHYQSLYGMPAGIYEVSVSAFNRYGGNGNDLTASESGTDNTAFLYAVNGEGETSTPLPFITSAAQTYATGVDGEGTLMIDAEGNETDNADLAAVTYYLPANMVSAAGYFEMGYYRNTLTVQVGSDGYLRIGIKKTENQSNGWCIIDSWQLMYLGADSQGIEERVVTGNKANVEFFTVDGRKASAAQKGIVIVRQTTADGTVVVNKIRK